MSGGCPVYHQTRGRIWDMRPWRLCFSTRGPFGKALLKDQAHLRLVRCWWRRPIPDRICSPCSSTCTRLAESGCWAEQGKSRYPSCVNRFLVTLLFVGPFSICAAAEKQLSPVLGECRYLLRRLGTRGEGHKIEFLSRCAYVLNCARRRAHLLP